MSRQDRLRGRSGWEYPGRGFNQLLGSITVETRPYENNVCVYMCSSFAKHVFGEERYSTFSLCWTPGEKFTVPVTFVILQG